MIGREWRDPRDQKRWQVSARGVPRRLSFKCMDSLEAYSTPVESFTPVNRLRDLDLANHLDRARSG